MCRWRVTLWVGFAYVGSSLLSNANGYFQEVEQTAAADKQAKKVTADDADDAKSTGDTSAELGALAAEEAVARFKQLLSQRPFHAQAFTGLVKYYVEKDKLDELVAEYETKANAGADDVNSQIVLARLYLRAEKPQQAADLLTKLEGSAVKLDKDNSKWMVFKAEVYQKSGNLAAAEKVLTEAISQTKVASEKFRLSEGLADIRLANNDRDNAANALLFLSKEYPTNFVHRKRVADSLVQRELLESALNEYKALLDITKDRVEERCEALRDLGRTYERLNRNQDAIDAYTQAIDLLAGSHWLQQELHERIVTLYRSAGRIDDLIQYCRDRQKRFPDQIPIRALLADVLASTGDNDGAKLTLSDAVQAFPKDRMLSDKRVQMLERLGDSAGAAAEYERIISQQPNDVELYIAYGQFLAANKQLSAARNQWKFVLNRDLTDAGLAHRLGNLFELFELPDDAVECYERSITLDPKRAESYAVLSRLWYFRGDKEKSAAILQRMAETNATDAATQAAVCQASLSLGMTDTALAAITKATELAPDQVDYQTVRADVLVQVGRLDDALSLRRTTIDRIPNHTQQSRAIDVLVSMYASAGKLDQLKSSEQQELSTNPKNIVCLLTLARAADAERDLAASDRWLKQVLAMEPTHEQALTQSAKIREAMGDLDAAVETYRRLVELHPARARQWYQSIADLLLQYEDRVGAVDTLTKIVQNTPDNPTVLKEVAEQLIRIGEYEKGLEYYEQALRLQPDRHEIRLAYANALTEAGRLEDALASYKLAALQKSDRESALEALGKLHQTAGKIGALDELLDDLETLVEADPDNSLVANALAELMIREFEYPRALDLLEGILHVRPRDAELEITRAELLRRLARFDEAYESYRRVLRMPNIDRDYVLGEMGKAYFEAGRVDQARALWRQITHKLYAGTLLQNNGLMKEAIEVFQEGIRLKPDDYSLHRNLIKALQGSGQTDAALAAARRLLDLDPDDVQNIRDLAKAYLEHGRRDAAAEIASRLFNSTVAEKKTNAQPSAGFGLSNLSLTAMSMRSMYSGYGWQYGNQKPRNNLEAAVKFFQENGLQAELRDVLKKQLDAQPSNSLLKHTAATVFHEAGDPDVTLKLLRELETATFPLERQQWLGQCSQRDYFRLQQYQLLASKPGLRDARLAELESKAESSLSRDDLLELAVVRQAQGLTDKSIELLKRVVDLDAEDVVARSSLVSTLVNAERFADAEPHAVKLVEQVAHRRVQMIDEMLERVRRDFVRNLSFEMQLRVTNELLRDIAQKWTLGQNLAGDLSGTTQVMGFFRAKLTLATIYAKTNRLDAAKAIWVELQPNNPADVEAWTWLAGVAQLYDENAVALSYYEKAIQAARLLASDQLLQKIFGGSMAEMWYGEEEGIDASFNKIVSTFAAHDRLLELYDFLRETNQVNKAKRVARQYDLYKKIKPIYEQRMLDAREQFLKSKDNPLDRSIPYFVAVCKAAELHDQSGHWDEAKQRYARYIEDFPDELGLLQTLSEAAEQQSDFAEALGWETKVVATKERLARQARAWSMRDLPIVPSIPQVLAAGNERRWDWPQRWGRNSWWVYGQRQRPFDTWPSWVRIAQLHLANDALPAASLALERALTAAAADREGVSRVVLAFIQDRQLNAKMLPVLRTLAVNLPTDEDAQMAFADSLEANKNTALAAEVYRRLLRRGVTDVGTLAQIKQRLAKLEPLAIESEVLTLAKLEETVAANPQDMSNRLRLAKAYFYSLDLDRALPAIRSVIEEAPHLEGVHDLLVDIYTIRGDSDLLIDALKQKIQRVSDGQQRTTARQRLAEELLARGQTDEALTILKELADPANPYTYEYVAMLLHYLGRHGEAIQQWELSGKSQQGNMWGGGGDRSGQMVARGYLAKGDLTATADKIMEAIDTQAKQAHQFAGMAAMYGYGGDQQNYFQQSLPLLIVEPALVEELQNRLKARRDANPADVQNAKLQEQFLRTIGRTADADAIIEQLSTKNQTDETHTAKQIDQAVKRREYDKAIELAKAFLSQQSKPTLPPGVPAEFAGMMSVMSPRNSMLCKLGDIYWKKGDKDAAFESYRQIVDKDVEQSKVVYATICLLHDRVDEAKKLIDEALTNQQVPSPSLLQLRAVMAALNGDNDSYFKDMATAAEQSEGQEEMRGGGGGIDSLAQLALRSGQLDRFVEFMNTRIERNPNNWNDHLTLCQTLFDAGRPNEAFAALDRAEKLKPLKQQALDLRIRWLEGNAEPKDLIPLYEEYIELAEKQTSNEGSIVQQMFGGGRRSSSGSGQAQTQRQRLGELYWYVGNQDRAIEAWIGRSDQRSPDTSAMIAQRCLAMEDFDRAEQAYRKVIELQPDRMDAHPALAQAAFARGDIQSTLTHLYEVFTSKSAASALSRQQRNQYSWDDENEGSSLRQGADADLRRIALGLLASPETESVIAKAEPSMQSTYRLMLASHVGDWKTIETELTPQMDKPCYDPMKWSLWANIQERKGDWAKAATAWEQVRRLNMTTIGKYREQLALVLAGKQVKEAAAGITDARAAAMQAQMGQQGMGSQAFTRYSSYGYYGYGNSDPVQPRLESIYMRLGQFEAAERMALLSRGSNAQYTLMRLGMQMWKKGESKRALELCRLAMVLSMDDNSLAQLAIVLSENGDTTRAVDMLTRAYTFRDSGEGDDEYRYYMGGGTASAIEFETQQEKQFAMPLYELLKRSGQLDNTLSEFQQKFDQEPGNTRLGKLIVSLDVQDRRWADARRVLENLTADPNPEPAYLMQLFYMCAQLADWDAADKRLTELQQLEPDSIEQWSRLGSFTKLMAKDPKGAVTAVQPFLATGKQSKGSNAAFGPKQVAMILSCAQDSTKLKDYLETLNKEGLLDDAGLGLLADVCLSLNDDKSALCIALDRVWETPELPKRGSAPFDSLSRTVHALGTKIDSLSAELSSPEDRALVESIHKGPQTAIPTLRKILTDNPDSVNARRALVSALVAAGDCASAVQENKELVTRLSAKSNEVWRSKQVASLQSRLQSALNQAKSNGIDSTSLLNQMGYGSTALQMLMNDYDYDPSDSNEPVIRFARLRDAHVELQRELYASVADTQDLAEATRQKLVRRTGGPSGNSYRRSNYAYYGGSSMAHYDQYGNPMSRQGWQQQFRNVLHDYSIWDALATRYDELGNRIPQQEWTDATEAYSSLGRAKDACNLRTRISAGWLADLRASSTSEDTRWDDWNWGWMQPIDSQQRQLLKSALAVAIATPDPTEEFEPSTALRGQVDLFSEMAYVDPDFAKQMDSLAGEITSNGGASRIVTQYVRYVLSQKKPKLALEVLDRAFTDEDFTKMPVLSDYLRACFAAKDMQRLEKVLASIQKRDASLGKEIDLARLTMLRLIDKNDEADTIEKQLLKDHPPAPDYLVQPDSRIADSLAAYMGQNNSNRNYTYYNYDNVQVRRSSGNRANPTPWVLEWTAGDIARSLGIWNFDPKPEGVTLEEVRNAYVAKELWSHAARLSDLELNELTANSSARRRASLTASKARYLAKAGDTEAAKNAATEAERLWLAEAAKDPLDADPLRELASLYSGPAYGFAFDKALTVLQTQEKIAPSVDVNNETKARYLFELGRYNESWEYFRSAVTHGAALENGNLFRAGLAGVKSGDKTRGEQLLRQALWRNPHHKLAAAAMEIVHE